MLQLAFAQSCQIFLLNKSNFLYNNILNLGAWDDTNLVEIKISDEDNDRKFLRNTNLNEIRDDTRHKSNIYKLL
jgi:hypothetical protein